PGVSQVAPGTLEAPTLRNVRGVTIVNARDCPRELVPRDRSNMKGPNTQRRFSRIFHWIGELTSRSSAALVTVVIVIAFGVLLAIAGFPPNWETAFSCAAAAVTL